tara:strand:+ start:807 stop:1181 length:375 start_codon:yes stop_codon:yes gene_type:complete
MDNLLKETINDIVESGHTPDDIIFIGSEETGHQCTWGEFRDLADKEYCGGFGASDVATDLVIVFSDGSKMWRGEYDGSEWWEYSKPFVKPEESKPIKELFATKMGHVGWRKLSELNDYHKKSWQ